MAFVKTLEDFATATGSSTTIAKAVTGLTAGRLVLAHVKHESTTPTSATTVSDGTTSFTPATVIHHSNNDVHGQWFYHLVGNGGNKTITATFTPAKTFRHLMVLEFSYEIEAIFADEAGAFGTAGSSVVISSGDFDTTVAAALAVGGYCDNSGRTMSAPRIDDIAADGSYVPSPGSDRSQAWWRILSATMTGDADITIGNSGAWIVTAIAFHDGSPAGGPSPWMRYNQIPGVKKVFSLGA